MHPPSPIQEQRDAASGRPATAVLDEIVAEVRSARRFVLFSHVNPDGDALGSLAALGTGLRRLGKEARMVCGEPPPEKFRALFPPGLIEVLPGPESLEPVDVAFLLDTSDPHRAGPFRHMLHPSKPVAHRRICIDHHLVSTSLDYDRQLIVPAAASTSSLILALLDRLEVGIDPELALYVWVGLSTDTGWFRFSNTDAWALSDAARLVGLGVRPEPLYQKVYSDLTSGRARVLGSVLSGVRSELDGRMVWAVLPRARYVEEGVSMADLDGIVDYLKLVRGAEIVALLVEIKDGAHKVSLRSTGDAEVESTARHFGGGGHAKAAGYRFSGTVEALVDALVTRMRPRLLEGASGNGGGGSDG